MARTNEYGMSEAQAARRLLQERLGSSRDIGTPEINRAISHRARWENALGADLGGVRVHDNPRAHDLSRELSAEAFTGGQDIFFAPGRRHHGEDLLDHELAHAVQQVQGRP